MYAIVKLASMDGRNRSGSSFVLAPHFGKLNDHLGMNPQANSQSPLKWTEESDSPLQWTFGVNTAL